MQEAGCPQTLCTVAAAVRSKPWAGKTHQSYGLLSDQFEGKVSPTVKEKTVQREVFGCFSMWKISKISLVRVGNGF